MFTHLKKKTMTLIIRKIPNELSYEELYDYFPDYGKINEFRIKYNCGYLTYASFDAERRVLHNYHKVAGFNLNIDRLNTRDSFDRCIHCPIHCGGRDRDFSLREERNYDRPQRGHPLDKFKVVLDNIPEYSIVELKEFVRSIRLDPVYARITHSRQHGIVEFNSLEAKENALRVLDNITFKNMQLGCKPYYMRERRDFEGNDGYRRRESVNEDDNQINMKEPNKSRTNQIENSELCDDLKGWNQNIVDSRKA